MMIVRSIGVLSLGKVLGSIYAILGLLAGLFFGLISLAGVAANAQQGGAIPFAGLGILAIIVLPIVYGVLGFISGIITAALYNLVAAMVGGLRLEFERPAAPNVP